MISKGNLRFALVTIRMFCKQQFPDCQECPISITCARRCFQDIKVIAGEAIEEMDKEDKR